eukprot:946940-Lingulodinium_polyedra.AAC.1
MGPDLIRGRLRHGCPSLQVQSLLKIPKLLPRPTVPTFIPQTHRVIMWTYGHRILPSPTQPCPRKPDEVG